MCYNSLSFLSCGDRTCIFHASMKAQIFLPLLGMAVAISFSSCSQNKDATNDAETATEIANGTMPPWIAESSAGYESAKYENVSKSTATKPDKTYAYNPPSKPSVSKSSSSKSSKIKKGKASSSKKSLKRSKNKSSSRKASSRKKSSSAYKVRKGDTLSVIARRQGSSVKAIKQANGLRSDAIHIGQNLKVPKK